MKQKRREGGALFALALTPQPRGMRSIAEHDIVVAQLLVLRGFPCRAFDSYRRVVLRRAGALDFGLLAVTWLEFITKKGQSLKMVISLLISRHAAADCPANNERWGQATLDAMNKLGEFAAKHGVTILASCVVHSEHLVVKVFEAASFEALEAFSAEPVIMNALNYQTTEMKIATTMQESMQRVMQAQQATQA